LQAIGLRSKRSRSTEASPSAKTAAAAGGGGGIHDTEEEEEGGVDNDDDYEDGHNNKFAAAGGGRMYNDRKRGRTATPSLINSYAKPPITTTTTIKLPFNAHHHYHHQQQQHFMAPPQSAPTTNNNNNTATAPPSLFTAVTGDTNTIVGTSFTGDDVATNSNNKMLQSNAAPGTSGLIESSPLVMPSFNTMHHCDNDNNNNTTTKNNSHCHYHYQQSTPLHLNMHRTPVGHGNHHQYHHHQQQQQHSHNHYDLSMGHHIFGGHHFQSHHNFELPLVPSSVFGIDIDRPDHGSVFNGNGGRGSGLFFSSPDLEAPPVYTSNNFIGTVTSPFLGIYLHNDDKSHPQVGGGQYGTTNITTTNVSPRLNQPAERQQQQQQKEEIREIMVNHKTRDTITPPPAAAAVSGGENHNHGSHPSQEEGSVSPACDGKNLLSPNSEEPIEGHNHHHNNNNNNGGDNGNANGQTGFPDNNNNNNPCDAVDMAVERGIAIVANHGDGQRQQQQQYGDASINPLPPTHHQQQQQHNHHHSDQSLMQKMHQIERKVSGVEERWGSMHLNAGKAHLLMYHACQHPALAAHYEARGREALERSFTIMAYNGGREAVEQVEKDIAGGLGGGRE